MKNKFLRWSAVFGGTAVVLGAFGAHALNDVLTVDQLHIYQTGITYQFYHSLALMGCGVLSWMKSNRWLNRAAQFFIAGIFLFSGSLYLLAIPRMPEMIGIITPVGGLCFIAGWICLLIASLGKE